MISNETKRKLNRNEPVVGALVFSIDPALPEILGGIGYDFAIIDMEHSAKTWQQLEIMIRACENGGITSIIRVPDLTSHQILSVLELGAQGVMIPHVQSALDAKRAVQLVRYPPMGSRGCCSSVRATRYSLEPWLEHARRSNDEILLVLSIEDAAAVNNVKEIASVDGVDVVKPGRVDLGASLGLDGQLELPELLKVISRIISDTTSVGKTTGMLVYSPADCRKWVQEGCKFLIYSQDFKVIVSAYKNALQEIRSVLK